MPGGEDQNDTEIRPNRGDGRAAMREFARADA